MFYVSTHFVFGNVEEGRFLESVFLFFGLKVFVISVRPGEKYSFLFSNDCVPFIEKTVLFFVHFQQQQQLQKKSSLRKISSDQDTQSRSSLYL